MPVYGSLSAFRNASVRTGVYAGGCLAVIFNAWVVVATRAPLLEQFALPRNLAAAALLGLAALIPVLRFWRMPGNLLASSLVGWLIFSFDYRLLCFYFKGLEQRYSAVQIFVLGAVPYMLVVTLSWLGTIIRRVRASGMAQPDHEATHQNHHVS